MSLPIAQPVWLPVAERFISIQGEGKLTGVPSWFVRLSGCNLRCAWCDTPYASWKPEGTQRTVEELVSEAVAARDAGVTHAVVTGGEPMMFEGSERLVSELDRAGVHVTIETAGTIFRELPARLMSISPKLSNSRPPQSAGEWAARHEARRINIPVLQQLLDRYPQRQLKFVVTPHTDLAPSTDLAEIEAILASLRGVAPEDVMLMPEGVSLPTREQARTIASLCVSRGWRYCHRLHIELFGNTRGT